MAIEAQRYVNKGENLLEENIPEELTVELPEEMDIQGENTSEFQVSPDGDVTPIMESEEALATDHNVNLTNILDDSMLASLSSELISAFEEDKNSRDEWLTTFADGLEL